MALEAACANKRRVLTYAISIDGEHGGDPMAGHEVAPSLIQTLSRPGDARGDPEAWLLVREQLACVRRALPTLSSKAEAGARGARSTASATSSSRRCSAAPAKRHPTSSCAHGAGSPPLYPRPVERSRRSRQGRV